MTPREEAPVTVTPEDVALFSELSDGRKNASTKLETIARHRTQAAAAAKAREEELAALRNIAGEAAFLLARLSDLDWAQSFESFARDYDGHVDPSESRLRNLIAEYRAALSASDGEAGHED